MIYYKIDVIQALKDKGLTTYDIQVKNGLNSRTIKEIKQGKICGVLSLDKLCKMLECQPADLIGYKPDLEEPEYYI